MQRSQRVVAMGVICLAAVWLAAWGGFRLAQASKATAEKVRAYLEAVDLASLEGDARAGALRELARRINGLSLEERRRFRMGRVWERWFEEMTESEKGEFVEATLPTGFQQVLLSFEQMPESNRRTAVREAMKRLAEARSMEEDHDWMAEAGTNGPPVLSEEMQQKVIQLGLKSYYSGSSARTKAELAPVLEEIQRMMESGRFFRGRQRHE